MRTMRTAAAAALALTSALGLVACGKDGDDAGGMPGTHHGTKTTSSATAPAADHNEADVKFATEMIPHHQQAVTMADLALQKAGNATVKQLATAIKAAQDPEIKQLSGWLTGWGEMVPTPGTGHEMSHGEGMMTEQEMAALGKAGGAAFDRMWVQLMIKHHQGAVTMAQTEQTAGESTTAVALAKTIETAQTAEIATMQKLLTQLP